MPKSEILKISRNDRDLCKVEESSLSPRKQIESRRFRNFQQNSERRRVDNQYPIRNYLLELAKQIVIYNSETSLNKIPLT